MAASDGYCAIKEEYVIKNAKKPETEESIVGEEPVAKRAKTDDGDDAPEGRRKQKEGQRGGRRGQNKGRPKPPREAAEARPCPSVANVREGATPEPCPRADCPFVHDPVAYLATKAPDLGERCHAFETRGECAWGLACRYGAAHLTKEGRNRVDESKRNGKCAETLNNIDFDTTLKLQRKKYDFGEAESRARAVFDAVKAANRKDSDVPVGPVVVARAEKRSPKTTIDWRDKLYLGPLTTLGNLPFRRVCKEFGADVTCGEMVMCDSLVKGNKQEWALVKRHPTEDLFGVQICGSNPFIVSKACRLIEDKLEVDFVDLNLGCPIDLVYKKGAGCGMLQRTNALEASVRCASEILSVPFTVKTRVGINQDARIAHELAPKFFEWGASLLTVHGRSREQRYTKFSDWEYIDKCAAACVPGDNPVFGNGDILSYDDYARCRKLAPNARGAMICRGALIKPWIFAEIKERRLWDISSGERLDALKTYVNYGLEHWGSDARGVENTRRFLLEWCSFLYRYVPVGLLERPPQRINERPPHYRGRDELETLMASPNCADWIKLSEMLLGRVPDDFRFLPKHKANSYA